MPPTRGKQVVLHIGLHKTGTRYIQRMVLAPLDAERFVVDPPEIARPLRRVLRGVADAPTRQQLEAAVAAWRASDDCRVLVISQPHASGDMYSSHHDFPGNARLLQRLFPEATILYMVRHQARWLQSAYRQQLVKGKGVSVRTFLNCVDGDFQPRPHRWLAGTRTLEALSLKFLGIYRAYAEAFGAERVYLLRQEDMRRRKGAVDARIAEALGIEALPEPPHGRSQNRSFSALAIRLFYPGTMRAARSPRPHHIGRGPGRLHDRLRVLRRLRTHFIRHVFDRLVYVDWDLFEAHGLNERIDAHYAYENRELAEIAARVLDEGPRALAQTRPDPVSA